MATKEELEAQVNAWKGKNKYLWDEARGKLKDGDFDKPKEVKTLKTYEQYKKMTVKELKNIAKRKNIKHYSSMNEDPLIESIMEVDKNE